MATGSLDANGIWQYGEDDSEATFSALLNKLGGSTSTQIASAKISGRVIQTVNANLTTTFTSSSTSLITTGLAATITPRSATSKILAIVHQTADLAANRDVYATLYRGATNLGAPNMSGVYAGSSTIISQLGFTYLDSPATTSATTYTIYAKGTTGSPWNIIGYNRSITLLEIAA